MYNSITAANLEKFVNSALLVNTVYFRERRILWETFSDYLRLGGDIIIPFNLLISIKSALCCRNLNLDDNKLLSLNTSLSSLSTLIPNLEQEGKEVNLLKE